MKDETDTLGYDRSAKQMINVLHELPTVQLFIVTTIVVNI